MDRRSWPWRKKSSDRTSATVLADNESPLPGSHQTKLFNDQDLSKILSYTGIKSDNAVTRLQQAEEKLQLLTEKLSVTLSENTTKENLVKQHTKVAEEAVCGWEKAEAEAASLKLELENAVQQKAAVEVQLSHVDGALKECMRQLRQAREDQEQKIHEVIIRNKQEWDKVQSGFEIRLAELNHLLLESKAENEVLTRALQERGRMIAELNNAKTHVQTELSIFQIRLDSAEKDNASLKYEVQVLNKELDIRNEEREYSKRENEVCNKQHLEDTKKIAKLEAECQKLRVFVRRKLPGPAALAQMKTEVELFGSEAGDTLRQRISGKLPGPYGASHLEAMQQRLQNGNREVEMLTERMHVMEEEARMLRESLAQRNSELHSAKLMCARTASKLSTVESQLEALSHGSNLSGTRLSGVDAQVTGARDLTGSKTASVLSLSDGSFQGDEASSDAWASALVSELAHLKKQKPSISPENLLDSEKLSLMDDFAQMEQLALSVMSEDLNLYTESNKRNEASKDPNVDQMKGLPSLDGQNKLTPNVNLVCLELGNKLAATEKQLSELKSKYHENQVALVDVQQGLGEILDAYSNGVDLSVSLEKAGAAFAALKTCCQSTNNGTAVITHFLSSEDTKFSGIKIATCEDAEEVIEDETYDKITSEIIDYQKIIKVLQTLAQKLGTIPTHKVSQLLPDDPDPKAPSTSKIESPKAPSTSKIESLLLDDGLQKLFDLTNKFLEGESSMSELMKELYLFMDKFANVFISLEVSAWEVPIKCHMKDTTSISESHMLENARQALESSSSRFEVNEEITPQESLTHRNLKVESKRLAGLEEQLLSLNAKKTELEHSLEEALQKIESITVQLGRADQLLTELQDKLELCQQSKQLMEEQLAGKKALTADLESQVKSRDSLIGEMKGKIHGLEIELQEERDSSKRTLVKLQELQQQLDSLGNCAEKTLTEVNTSEGLHPSAETVARSRKDKEFTEAAEKLAECQRSILFLGEKLKALSSPKQSPEASFRSKTDAALSAEKVANSLEQRYYQSEELASEMDGSGRSMYPRGFMCSPGAAWYRSNGYQGLDRQSPWSPPTNGSSTYAPRGQIGSPLTEIKFARQVDRGMRRSSETQLPDDSAYTEAESLTPSSVDPSHHFAGKSPARFLATKKKGSNSQHLSKAFETTHSGKSNVSTFGRFFSRTKSQLS